MNRSKYFDYIEEKLNTLSSRVASRGKLNILNLHIHSENFYRDFFNLLYDYKLKNLNEIKQNIEAVDLISEEEKIFIQISATCTKDKIEGSLNKKLLKDYKDYSFKFISLVKNTNNEKRKMYKNDHGLAFDPQKDIYDVDNILSHILSLKIDKQKDVYDFIVKELGSEDVAIKLDSNLATLIDILSKEDLNNDDGEITVNSFEIERKISFNNLNRSNHIINDYGCYHNKLDKLYSEYDIVGKNKSQSVLLKIRNEYIKNINIDNDDDLFFLIIDNIKKIVINSANFISIPDEELSLCINIIVVDAFIRCKIFKNPNNYKYVTSR